MEKRYRVGSLLQSMLFGLSCVTLVCLTAFPITLVLDVGRDSLFHTQTIFVFYLPAIVCGFAVWRKCGAQVARGSIKDLISAGVVLGTSYGCLVGAAFLLALDVAFNFSSIFSALAQGAVIGAILGAFICSPIFMAALFAAKNVWVEQA